MPKVLRVLVFLVVPLTSISLCDRILPFRSFAFFFLTPLSYSTFPIVSATGTDTLAPCSDPLYTVPQDHLIPTYWDFTRLSLTVSVVLSVVFRCCMFLKRAAMFNIMKHDLPPPLPTIESSDEFRARSAELACIIHSTHVHHQNHTRRNVCKEKESLRLQNPRSSEMILLASVHQRWVVKEVLFLPFSSITEALCCYRLWLASLLIKPCQSCAAATPKTRPCSLSPPPAGSRPGLGAWGQRQTGAAAPRCPKTHRQQLTGKLTNMETRLLGDKGTLGFSRKGKC